jgi:Protein of unknown function (DUF1592)/Protein of unknown function (DUF1588)/Protein of unknown function (DUF1595)/Protein of unknown function (DUF1587)/Protein of unknown function (DUF1585)
MSAVVVRPPHFTCILLIAVSGCTGIIESPKQSPLSGSATLTPEVSASTESGSSSNQGNAAAGGGNTLRADDSKNGGAAATACSTRAVGTTPLRRLSRSEYNNSVADLLADTTHPASAFVADTQVGLFDNTAKTQTVPTLLAEQYLDSAVTLAEGVQDVNKLLGCDPAGDACVRGFVAHFGRRAFRRALTSDELSNYMSIYTTTRADSDASTGVRGVLAAVLASPHFLFRFEFGADGASDLDNAQQLTAYELSARLANLIWASAPDDQLLDAAESGKLATRDQVETQARRMLADPRARRALAEFYRQWFGLQRIETVSKDHATYPEFDDTLRAAMSEESRRFVEDVLWNGDAKLSTLLTASYSFVNDDLAELYGVEAPAGGGFAKVELNPEERAGIMTQAAVLAGYARPDQSSPVKRGQWVRTRLLCQPLPDPPANVPELAQPKQGVSNRERFAMHTSNPACSGCHNLIDGLGFGFEAYDGLGRFRTMDQGVPVDDSGEVTASDVNGNYNGAVELATRLAKSAQVRDCAPTQWMHYTLGRGDESDDTCSASELKQAFATSGGDLQELMVAITNTDAFLHYRQPE